VGSQVIDAHDRHAPGQTEALGRREAHRETGREPGTVGHGDPGHLLWSHRRQGALQQRTEMLQVLAAGEIGHDAAVGSMQDDLAVHPFTGDSGCGIKDGDCRLVAGTFEGEDHGWSLSLGTGLSALRGNTLAAGNPRD